MSDKQLHCTCSELPRKVSRSICMTFFSVGKWSSFINRSILAFPSEIESVCFRWKLLTRMAEREDAVQGAWEMKKSKWESRLKMVESDRTNGTNTSVSQMHPYVPASTDHRLFIPSHTRRPRSIHSPVSSLFLILKLLSTALLNNSMCCVEHVFESGLFRWFSEKF